MSKFCCQKTKKMVSFHITIATFTFRAVLRNLGARGKKKLGALFMNMKSKFFYMFQNLLLDLGFSKDLD
jgi:hypothetical protein